MAKIVQLIPESRFWYVWRDLEELPKRRACVADGALFAALLDDGTTALLYVTEDGAFKAVREDPAFVCMLNREDWTETEACQEGMQLLKERTAAADKAAPGKAVD
jgi:hypothetical protein